MVKKPSGDLGNHVHQDAHQQVDKSVSSAGSGVGGHGEVCPSHLERGNHSVLAPKESVPPHDFISWEGQ